MSMIRVNRTQDVVLVFSTEWDCKRIFSELLEKLLYKEILAAIMQELECQKQMFIVRTRSSRIFDCYDNQLTALDVSNNPGLDYLEDVNYVFGILLSLAQEPEFDIAQSFKHFECAVLYEYADKNCGMFSGDGRKKAAGNAKMQRKIVMKSKYVAEIEPVIYEGTKEPERDVSLSYKACLNKKSGFLYGRKRRHMDCLVCGARNPNHREVPGKNRTSLKREKLIYGLEKKKEKLMFHSICRTCKNEERKAEDIMHFSHKCKSSMKQSQLRGNLSESKIESNDGGSSKEI